MLAFQRCLVPFRPTLRHVLSCPSVGQNEVRCRGKHCKSLGAYISAKASRKEDESPDVEGDMPPRKERGLFEGLLTYRLRVTQGVSIRTGYLLASFLAGASGGGTLFLISASLLLLGSIIQVPSSISSSVSLLVVILLDFGRSSYGKVLGFDSPSVTIVPILLFVLATITTASLDPDTSLQPPASTPQQALERVRESEKEEVAQIESDERARIRRTLELNDNDQSEKDLTVERESQLYEWDRIYSKRKTADEGDN